MPAASTATKYHQGCTRWCISVVKRWKCSCTKKKCANSRFAADTAMNQGAAMARNSSAPGTMRRRRSSDPSRLSSR